MAGISAGDDFVSEINVTLFVDVMLVLLIIFMVTTPMMTEGLDVELLKVETSETLPTENDHMILTVKDNGALFLDEYETTLDDLAQVLQRTCSTLAASCLSAPIKTCPTVVVQT
jgi:biopolymer transport protein TolR